MYIGKNVVINSTYKANFYGNGMKTIILCSGEAELKIGDKVGISNTCIICEEGIIIGNGTIIGNGCSIYDTDCHSLNYMNRRDCRFDKPNKKRIVIGEECFIGAGSTILKGVTIGSKSIVGAKSVVTKDIPENEIWAGNPARFIKKIDERLQEI